MFASFFSLFTTADIVIAALLLAFMVFGFGLQIFAMVSKTNKLGSLGLIMASATLALSRKAHPYRQSVCFFVLLIAASVFFGAWLTVAVLTVNQIVGMYQFHALRHNVAGCADHVQALHDQRFANGLVL